MLCNWGSITYLGAQSEEIPFLLYVYVAVYPIVSLFQIKEKGYFPSKNMADEYTTLAKGVYEKF